MNYNSKTFHHISGYADFSILHYLVYLKDRERENKRIHQLILPKIATVARTVMAQRTKLGT